MSGIADEIVAGAVGTQTVSPGESQPYFGLFLAVRLWRSGNSERERGTLATHWAGRAYYIYVARQNAKSGILAVSPRGLWQADVLVTRNRPRPEQETGGDRPFRLCLKRPIQ